MSSSTYSVCLTPDPRLRRLIDRSGIAFALFGVILIWQLPQPLWMLLSGTVAWLAMYAWQIRRLRYGWRACRAIRALPGPTFEVQNRNGDWLPAELKSGSFVIGFVAWLRLSTNDSEEIVELLLRSRRRCNNWRRLQVIWRHIGAT